MRPAISTQMNPRTLQLLVDFFLNVYGDVEDARGLLRQKLSGDAALAERLFAAWQLLAHRDVERWKRVQMPEAGDVSLRKWILEAAAGTPSNTVQQDELELDEGSLPPKHRDPDKETIVYEGGPANRTGGGVYRNVTQVFYGWPDRASRKGEAIYLRTDDVDEGGRVVFRYFGHSHLKGNDAESGVSLLSERCPLAERRAAVASQLKFLPHVSERVLRMFGLATPEAWAQPCFSETNNRLILFADVACAAVVTSHDHAEAQVPARQRTGVSPKALEEIVAIEVLPKFRCLGIAAEVCRTFARDGRVRVNSPSDGVARALNRVGTLTEVDVSLFELKLK